MKKLNIREYAIDIYGHKNIYRVATKRMEIDGYEYVPAVIDVSYSTTRIDPESLSASLNEMSLSIRKEYADVPERGSMIIVREIKEDNFTVLRDRNRIVSTPTNEPKVIRFVAKVSDITVEGQDSYTLSVVFDRSNFFDEKNLPKLDKNTFARYLTFSPKVEDTEAYVPIVDLNEDAANPLGPITNIYLGRYVTQGANSSVFAPAVGTGIRFYAPEESGLNGYNDWKTFKISESFARNGYTWLRKGMLEADKMQVCVSKKVVDAFTYQHPSVGYAKDFYEGMTLFNSKRSVPMGKVVKVHTDYDSQNRVKGALIEFEVEEPMFLLMYASTMADSLQKYSGGTAEERLDQIQEFITSESRMGKLLPVAMRYRKFWLKSTTEYISEEIGVSKPWRGTDPNTYPEGTKQVSEMIPPDYSNGIVTRKNPQYITRTYAQIPYEDAHYIFEIDEKIDLRTQYGYRTASGMSGDNTDAEQSTSYQWSEETMYVQSYNQMGTMEDRVKLFDEGFCQTFDDSALLPLGSNSQNFKCELNWRKWFVASVQGTEVIKRVSVDVDAFRDIDLSELRGSRVDVINSDPIRESTMKVLDASGEPIDTEMNFEEVFEIADGRFGYIEDVFPTFPGRMNILFHTSRQWDSDTAQPSFPNALTLTDKNKGAIRSMLTTFRPMPENSPSEGSIIPIVYGKVKKFPALQAISKKANYGDPSSAGDDVYILCSNPLGRKDGNGVSVYWGLDEFASGASSVTAPGNESSIFQSGLDKAKKYWISNPLPRSANIPVVYLDRELAASEIPGLNTGDINRRIPVPILQYEVVPHPFHYVVEIEDNYGNYHSAIRLRGDECNPALGDMDPRHSIQFGLGSSAIHCSFIGMPDDEFGTITGLPKAPITNPAHILLHIIMNYGTVISEEQIDFRSFQIAAAKTRDIHLGVYLNDESLAVSDILQEITKASGIFLTFEKGKYKAKHFDLNPAQRPKYFISNSEVIDFETELHFPGVTDYKFSYDFDFPSDKFSSSFSLNSDNHKFISRAKTYAGVSKSEEVDFKFSFDSGSVKRVASDYINLMSGYRTRIAMNVFNDNTDLFDVEVCDVIEVSCSRGYDYVSQSDGFHKEKFLVYEVTPGRESVEIKALQIQTRNNFIPKGERRTPLFPPPPLPIQLGAIIWLDASDTSTLYTDSAGTVPVVSAGDPIGLWKNKGTLGSAGDAVQAVSANRPVWSLLDGGRAKFDGANSVMTIEHRMANWGFSVATDMRAYSGSYFVGTGANGEGHWSVVRSGNNGRGVEVSSLTGTGFNIVAYKTGAVQTDRIASVAVYQTVGTSAATSSDRVVSTTDITAPTPTTSINNIRIGAVRLTSLFVEMTLNHLIIFDRPLTVSEQDQLIAWMEANDHGSPGEI